MRQEYLSPRRFLAGGYGYLTPPSTVAALRNVLMRATATANTYCNGPLIPNKFDFRGGTVTQEQHTWIVPNAAPLTDIASRRIYLHQRPIRSVSALRIVFTSTYYIELSLPTDVFVNSGAGYVEIVASQPTIIGFPPIGYWFGLSQPVSETTYSYGWRFPIMGDILEDLAPDQFIASMGNWLEGGDVTVYVDGVEADPGDYSVDTDDGIVTFATSPAPGTTISADYTNILPTAIPQAVGLIAAQQLGEARNVERGLVGLQSLRVAEVALTALTPAQMVTKNGVSIPSPAAQLLDAFVVRSAA